MIYLKLAFEFIKIGLFAVGGGLATIPFLYDLSEKTGWFSSSQIIDMIAISESTPGPLGVNMATYVGYLTTGPFGGVVATLSLAFPSVVIIIIVSKILNRFKDSAVVSGLFSGFRPASMALITMAALEIFKESVMSVEADSLLGSVSFLALGLAVAFYIAITKLKWHPVAFVAIGAVLGIVLKL